MKLQRSTYIIRREDVAVDPVTLVTEGLLIGSLPDCEVFLNHPSISRSHAGIQRLDTHFYIFPLSPTNATTLNGTLVEDRRALASGDVMQIGPFLLTVERADEHLEIAVRLEVGLHIGDTRDRGSVEDLSSSTKTDAPSDAAAIPPPPAQTEPNAGQNATPETSEALGIFWQKRKREAGKIARPSPLHPRGEKRLGKSLYNWTPTTDLAPMSYGGVFAWAAILITVFAVGAIYFYADAFSPAPVSNPHTRTEFAFTPAVASVTNADSCTSCHTLTTSMDTACASCHKTEIFQSNTMTAHTEAGLSCAACHNEHQGADFRPRLASLNSCTQCHNDANKNTYNGRKVFTAHNNVVGYPVENGEWTWEGLDTDAWQHKDATVKEAAKRVPEESERQWRVKQFHALHMYRVRRVDGIEGNSSGEVSCSSCHKSFQPIDVETPRTTCAACHNGKMDVATGAKLIADNQANCTSCHVQHSADKRHWNPGMMSDQSNIARQTPTNADNAVAAHVTP